MTLKPSGAKIIEEIKGATPNVAQREPAHEGAANTQRKAPRRRGAFYCREGRAYLLIPFWGLVMLPP